MNDSLNGIKKTECKKIQIDLSIRKDGLTSGNSLISSSHFSCGGGARTLLTVFCAGL